MEYLIGLLLAAAVVGILPALAGIGRGRDFYPLMLFVVASYYVLFALIAGSAPAVVMELAVAGAFAAMAVLGFRTRLWVVAAGLVGHGVFDMVHPLFIDNRGVPAWWPGFCMTYDVVAGLALAVLLRKGARSATL